MAPPQSEQFEIDDSKMIESINNKYLSEGIKPESPRGSGITPPDIVRKITAEIIPKCALKEDNAENQVKVRLCIGALAQEGATSPRFADTRIGHYYEANILVKDIREACKKYNTTYRRLARALETHAIAAAELYDIPGNLSKAFKLDHPDATAEELRFASDYLTFTDNPKIPARTKTWLLANYNVRFGEKR